MTDFLDLPREMISEIVRYVNCDGLLALRKVIVIMFFYIGKITKLNIFFQLCQLTKTIVEEKCEIRNIENIRFWHEVIIITIFSFDYLYFIRPESLIFKFTLVFLKRLFL